MSAVCQMSRVVAITSVALAEATDAALIQPWALHRGGQEVFKMPRMAVLRRLTRWVSSKEEVRK